MNLYYFIIILLFLPLPCLPRETEGCWGLPCACCQHFNMSKIEFPDP